MQVEFIRNCCRRLKISLMLCTHSILVRMILPAVISRTWPAVKLKHMSQMCSTSSKTLFRLVYLCICLKLILSIVVVGMIKERRRKINMFLKQFYNTFRRKNIAKHVSFVSIFSIFYISSFMYERVTLFEVFSMQNQNLKLVNLK